MNKEILLNMYDTIKEFNVAIYMFHGNDYTMVTLEDLFRMFEAVRERNENAVSQD